MKDTEINHIDKYKSIGNIVYLTSTDDVIFTNKVNISKLLQSIIACTESLQNDCNIYDQSNEISFEKPYSLDQHCDAYVIFIESAIGILKKEAASMKSARICEENYEYQNIERDILRWCNNISNE